MLSFRNSKDLIFKVYQLALPYGRLKLAMVFGISLAQGILQVLGVTSIFPFLAVAADPQRIQNSQFGRRVLEFLPDMTNAELLTTTGVIAIVMLLLSSTMNLAATFFRNRYGQNFAHWMRIRLMRQIATQPYSYFLQHNPATFHKKVTQDVNVYTNSVLLPLLDATAQLVTIFLLSVTLFLVDPKISLGAIVLIGGYYLGFFIVLAPLRKTAQAQMKSANIGASKESLKFFNGIKPIKVSNAESYFVERYGRFSNIQAKLNAVLPIYGNAPRFLIEPIAFGGLVFYVIYLANSGGNFVNIIPNLGVIALAGYRLIPSVQMLYGQMTQIQTMSHSLDEVYDEFIQAEKQDIPGSGSGLAPDDIPFMESIALKHVYFRYPQAKNNVLDDLSLVIEKGDSIALVGPSGTGKSTLVDLLLGLHQPDSGEMLVDGRALSAIDMPAWRSHVGYVPQDIYLVDDTVKSNIAFGVDDKQLDRDLLREVASKAQILHYIENELPDGFDTIVGERGVRLSGGQRQRIGLARALYRKPRLLILDEATSSLDHETESLVTDALDQLQGEITLVVIAHRLSTIENIPSKYTLKHGQLTEFANLKSRDAS